MAKKGIDGNAKRTSAINYTPSSLGFIMISARCPRICRLLRSPSCAPTPMCISAPL